MYSLDHPIVVTRPDTVVLGLGFPTLVPAHGNVSMLVASVPGVKLSGMLTIFLSTAGSGGIDHVVNGTGGSSTIANPDSPVDVVSYP